MTYPLFLKGEYEDKDDGYSMPFGKWEGLALYELVRTEKRYFKWLLKNFEGWDNFPNTEHAIRELL